MWLPKDERILLAFCCTKTSRGEAPFDIRYQELVEKLKSKRMYADKQSVREILFKLRNRNLLRLCSSMEGNGARITLHQQGYDLGVTYGSRGGIIAIWCEEYMWIWVIFGVIIGLITLLVTMLKD